MRPHHHLRDFQRRCAILCLLITLSLGLATAATACSDAAQPVPAPTVASAPAVAATPPPATRVASPSPGGITPSAPRGTPPAGAATATRSTPPAVTRAGTPTTRAAAGPTPTNVPGPVAIPTAPPLADRPALQTARFRFFDPEGTHGAQLALLGAEADAIYDYVSGRTGLRLDRPIAVVVQTPAPGNCPARGVAFSGGERIGLFAGPETSAEQLRAVLAHETVHILHFAAVRDGRTDLTLAEGLANWASLRYWSAWQGFASFEDATRAYLADGRFVPLDDPPADCTVPRRDVIYNERASFVGYLIDRYGFDRLLAASGTEVPASGGSLEQVADYQAVYGQSFAQLIADWLAWVRAGGTGP